MFKYKKKKNRKKVKRQNSILRRFLLHRFLEENIFGPRPRERFAGNALWHISARIILLEQLVRANSIGHGRMRWGLIAAKRGRRWLLISESGHGRLRGRRFGCVIEINFVVLLLAGLLVGDVGILGAAVLVAHLISCGRRLRFCRFGFDLCGGFYDGDCRRRIRWMIVVSSTS